MEISSAVKEILKNYESDSPGTKANLVRLLLQGRLANTGRMIIYPVDQGFEHGPGRSFASNPQAYDPHYHIKLAIDAGLSAFAAPLGMLEAGAGTFAGQIPTILKMNSANSLSRHSSNALEADQAVTASVDDALRLGCSAIGFTIYPGTDTTYNLFEEIRAIGEEAKRKGLAVVIWSYPRGNMSREGETAIDVVGYAAHMACLLGAHIVKVKMPTQHIEFREAKEEYQQNKIDVSTHEARLRHIRECCFSGRRMVVFSGGASKPIDEVYEEARAIHNSGTNGSIIGRNVFRRPRTEALKLLDDLVNIYLGQ
jgi:class I fructose-bisphosphate aldolase